MVRRRGRADVEVRPFNGRRLGPCGFLASAAPSVDLVTWCPASRGRRRAVSTNRTVGAGRRPPHRRAGAVDPDRTDRAQTTRRRDGRLAGPSLRLRGLIGAVGLADRRCHHHGGDAHGGRTAASVRRHRFMARSSRSAAFVGRHVNGRCRSVAQPIRRFMDVSISARHVNVTPRLEEVIRGNHVGSLPRRAPTRGGALR